MTTEQTFALLGIAIFILSYIVNTVYSYGWEDVKKCIKTIIKAFKET